MQNLPCISKQFQPMQRIPMKTPTVQKPCTDRASPDFSGLHNKKERQILRFVVQNLGNVAIFCKSWSHSNDLIKIGRIDGDGIEALNIGGDIAVKFERQ